MSARRRSFREIPEAGYLERMAVLGEMFADAAHEINNLMGTAASYAELEMHHAKAKASVNLEKILIHTRLAGEVALNVLHFASPPTADVGNVEDALAAAMGLYTCRARKGIRFLREGPRDLPAVRIPTHHLQLALANVIRNALDAVEHVELTQQEIRVTTKATARDVIIEIWDSGPAIEPAVLKHVFERFFTTKPSGTGTGLGLAITRRLVTESGGRLSAANAPDGGVTFTITLPRSSGRRVIRQTDDHHGRAEVSGSRILVVDDEDSMREVLQLLLRETAHSQVDVCGSGAEALDLLAQREYDAVVLDLRMPGLSGEDTYHRMPRRLKKRVVFITGDIIRETTSNFLRLTHQPALVKPLLSDDLLNAISKVADTIGETRHGG